MLYRLFLLCALLSSLYLEGALATEKAGSIRLIQLATVSSNTIRLGDIALIEKGDAALKEALINVEVAKAPSLYAKKSLYPYQIQAALSKAGMRNIEIFGEFTEVSLKTKVMTSTALKSKIEDYVKQKLVNREFSMRFLKIADSWEIPAAIEALEIHPSNDRLKGNVTFMLKAMQGENVLASLQIKTYISLYDTVARLKRPLSRQGKVSLNDLSFEKQDITQLDGMQIASFQEIEGLAAKKELPKGALLKKGDFDAPLLVKRGDICRIIVENGPIRMAITGAQALQQGKKGEAILFTNPMQPGKNLKALCVNPGVALIKIN